MTLGMCIGADCDCPAPGAYDCSFCLSATTPSTVTASFAGILAGSSGAPCSTCPDLDSDYVLTQSSFGPCTWLYDFTWDCDGVTKNARIFLQISGDTGTIGSPNITLQFIFDLSVLSGAVANFSNFTASTPDCGFSSYNMDNGNFSETGGCDATTATCILNTP